MPGEIGAFGSEKTRKAGGDGELAGLEDERGEGGELAGAGRAKAVERGRRRAGGTQGGRAGDCDDADPRSREIHAFPERTDDENGRNIRYTW